MEPRVPSLHMAHSESRKFAMGLEHVSVQVMAERGGFGGKTGHHGRTRVMMLCANNRDDSGNIEPTIRCQAGISSDFWPSPFAMLSWPIIVIS